MEEKFAKVQKERDDMHYKYEQAIEQLRQRTDYKNTVLEDKLGVLGNEFEKKEAQLRELV